eukprot:TCONS_00049001-protein
MIIEQGSSIGGTWWWNKYPGCACDVPAYQYSFSFFKHEWSCPNPGQAETLAYIEKLADHYGLHEHIKLDTKVTECVFDDEYQVWMVSTSKKETITCSHLVSAIGALNIPKYPDIPGIDDFAGDSMHTSRWPIGYDLTGKRVAVVGTGCSAAQLIPSIVGKVRELFVFQRSAGLVFPPLCIQTPKSIQGNDQLKYMWNLFLRCLGFIMGDLTVKYIYTTTSNFLTRVVQDAIVKDMSNQIDSEELRQKLIPKEALGTKRGILRDDYLPCFNNPKVKLVDQKISCITQTGIETNDATSYSVDTIIYATGFDSLGSMKNLCISRNGKTLTKSWNNCPNAYNGVMCPGFPNFFILLGPNTVLAHNSVLFMVECQVNFMLDLISKTIKRKAKTVEVKEEANTEYQNNLQDTMKKLTYTGENGCKSWYVNSKGINFTLWPTTCTYYWNSLRNFKVEHFIFK